MQYLYRWRRGATLVWSKQVQVSNKHDSEFFFILKNNELIDIIDTTLKG